METSLATEIAETIQTAHINRAPSPGHDLNPSTAVSDRQLVSLQSDTHRPKFYAELDDGDEEEVPYSIIKPRRRSTTLPPMPDLRFEQSYLNSISKADTWGKIAWITARDQVMMPLIQGVVYNLVLLGWQSWNRNAIIHGNTIGARVRRWWYGVNNWPVPARSR